MQDELKRMCEMLSEMHKKRRGRSREKHDCSKKRRIEQLEQ